MSPFKRCLGFHQLGSWDRSIGYAESHADAVHGRKADRFLFFPDSFIKR